MLSLWFIQKIYFLCIIQFFYSSAAENVTHFLKNTNNIISKKTLTIRGQITTDVILPCTLPQIKNVENVNWWYCGQNCRKIGGLSKNKVYTEWTRSDSYKILFNETTSLDLLLINVRRELVDRYHCVIELNNNQYEVLTVNFRLNFSYWFAHRWDSLFYGSCLSSLVFCAASFVFNIIWIICRKTVLWWINRAERMSRVRSMVEAMEKYRQRQIENLHETYNKRVTTIRDNYHQQVEQLRTSYANQAGRFRGYRQTQMENVTQHLDNIKENYNQQLNRIRDYGSRRVDQLWENYERQLNRVRLFTLQQRLRLQRRYKVKQRYINKLLETIGDNSSPELIEKKEAEIRAALNIDNLEFQKPPEILRSSSYFSLPEFVVEYEHNKNQSFSENLCKTPSTSKTISTKPALNIFENKSQNQFNRMRNYQPTYQTSVIRLKTQNNDQPFSSFTGSENVILKSNSTDNIVSSVTAKKA